MFKIHTRDGNTTRLDLRDEEQAKQWLRREREREFQQMISGITALQECGGRFRCPGCNRSKYLVCSRCGRNEERATCGKSAQFSLARPSGFDDVFCHVEYVAPNPSEHSKGGQKIVCHLGDDNVRLTMFVHNEQPSVRVSLLKTGKQTYNPLLKE